MSALDERQVAAADLEAALTDWFPALDALLVHQIAVLAIAAYDRAVGGGHWLSPRELIDGCSCDPKDQAFHERGCAHG